MLSLKEVFFDILINEGFSEKNLLSQNKYRLSFS